MKSPKLKKPFSQPSPSRSPVASSIPVIAPYGTPTGGGGGGGSKPVGSPIGGSKPVGSPIGGFKPVGGKPSWWTRSPTITRYPTWSPTLSQPPTLSQSPTWSPTSSFAPSSKWTWSPTWSPTSSFAPSSKWTWSPTLSQRPQSPTWPPFTLFPTPTWPPTLTLTPTWPPTFSHAPSSDWPVTKLSITGTLTWFEAHEYAVSNGYKLPTRNDLKSSGVRPERGINTDEWQPVRRVDSIEGDYVNVGTWTGDSNYISHLDEERIDTLPLWGNTTTAAVYRSSTYMFAVTCL